MRDWNGLHCDDEERLSTFVDGNERQNLEYSSRRRFLFSGWSHLVVVRDEIAAGIGACAAMTHDRKSRSAD